MRRRFDSGGPGGAPHSQATTDRRRKKAHGALLRRLGKEAWRTEERQAKRLRELGASGEDVESKREKFARTLRRNLATVVELQRHMAGTAEESLSRRLRPRFRRAEESAKKQLGNLAHSFESKITNGTLVRRSRVAWAAVHNEGGRVGHGARVPARPFLFLEEEDVDVLVEILRNRMLLALE